MAHEASRRTRLAAGVAGLAVLLGSATAALPAAANPPHITVGGPAPCTRTALQAGLVRGSQPVRGGRIGHPFGCRAGWAYAAVDTRRFTLTVLLRDRGDRWVTVDRGTACRTRAVPAALYKPGCETN